MRGSRSSQGDLAALARWVRDVHGDAKVDNFCVGTGAVAAVDFQYVGGGVGVQDVVYLLASCLDAEARRHHAPSLVQRLQPGRVGALARGRSIRESVS